MEATLNPSEISNNNTNKTSDLIGKTPEELIGPRESNGRFKAGNKAHELRKVYGSKRTEHTWAFVKEIKSEELAALARKLYNDAMKGNNQAAKLLLDNVLEFQKLEMNINGDNAQVNSILNKTEMENVLQLRYQEVKEEKDNKQRDELKSLFVEQLQQKLITRDKYNDLINRYCPNHHKELVPLISDKPSVEK